MYPVVLYDDDCGVCTWFAHKIRRFLRVPIAPMHEPTLTEYGTRVLGDTYWESFHVLNAERISTNQAAILDLASLFPAHKIFVHVASIPLVMHLLYSFLNLLKRIRKQSCTIN